MTARHGIRILVAALALGALALPAAAQSAASGSMMVSVTVARSCSVAAPTTAAPSVPSVRLSCGRGATTASPLRGAVVPVAGAPAAASLDTSKNQHGLVVSVNF
jgi:hypothetical protein